MVEVASLVVVAVVAVMVVMGRPPATLLVVILDSSSSSNLDTLVATLVAILVAVPMATLVANNLGSSLGMVEVVVPPGGVVLALGGVALRQDRSSASDVGRQAISLPIVKNLWLMWQVWFKRMSTVRRRSQLRCLGRSFSPQRSRQCQVSRYSLLASPF